MKDRRILAQRLGLVKIKVLSCGRPGSGPANRSVSETVA